VVDVERISGQEKRGRGGAMCPFAGGLSRSLMKVPAVERRALSGRGKENGPIEKGVRFHEL